MSERISWEHDDHIHGWWIEPGRVLAGEYPGAENRSETLQRLRILIESGVRTFVDLTTSSEGLTPYEDLLGQAADQGESPVQRSALRRLSFPIPEDGALPVGDYDAILDAIEAAGQQGGVYVHGRSDLGRTGTVAGCIFVDSGLSYEGAMRTIKERRELSRHADQRSPRSYIQRETIAQRARRR